VFLAVMIAVVLFVFRCVIARPIGPSAPGALRAVGAAGAVAVAAGLVAVPVYLLLSTANFAARSPAAVGALVPLMRISSFGRAMADLGVLLVLFAVCVAICVWVGRPERPRRSVVELLALGSAAASAAALLLVPGLAGHPAQTSPRLLALALDWTHLAAGSVWLGGLVGLLVLWFAAGRSGRAAALRTVVPRFSRVALGSVLALAATGVAEAVEHLPTLGALWETDYGRSLVVKGALLGAALVLGAGVLVARGARR
jgi:copper transport protein